mmetsp:Transcript_79563/g.213701  ORF Transcript_79563/g.213701 Transcript_79563/m.213701 type:complete len:204 (-) Transcript_79563:254-865(-)
MAAAGGGRGAPRSVHSAWGGHLGVGVEPEVERGKLVHQEAEERAELSRGGGGPHASRRRGVLRLAHRGPVHLLQGPQGSAQLVPLAHAAVQGGRGSSRRPGQGRDESRGRVSVVLPRQQSTGRRGVRQGRVLHAAARGVDLTRGHRPGALPRCAGGRSSSAGLISTGMMSVSYAASPFWCGGVVESDIVDGAAHYGHALDRAC